MVNNQPLAVSQAGPKMNTILVFLTTYAQPILNFFNWLAEKITQRKANTAKAKIDAAVQSGDVNSINQDLSK